MNEQRVTYAELKLAKDSKRPQVKPKGSKSSTTVTEQGVTYAELSLHNAALDPQENGKSCHLKGLAAPPEKCIAGTLGLTCLVLIGIIVAVLAISYTTEEPRQNGFSSEQNDCPNVTKSQEEYHCGPCPQGWFSYSNNCYYFSAEKKNLEGEHEGLSVYELSAALHRISRRNEIYGIHTGFVMDWSLPFWQRSAMDIGKWVIFPTRDKRIIIC
ncbi:NKG2-F type II integral membrane protein-like [Talpa occidentalis]|uniref:NKG2-F type II integral membrane protein-like n=1 Tax=Talpa occidentalis TaxID=50954 RepID=UPI00188F86A8|nr:NKG2-F type II integral membrane protein-like [Talpa occidentalis]